MTRAEAAPSSIAEYEKDHSVSRHLPGSAAGPNKAGRTAPSGGAELGIEMGGEADARRERDQAVAEGDIIPPSAQGTTSAGQLGFGQLNGQEQGIQTPGAEARDQQQQDRNSEWQSNQPDLRDIARSSGGSAAHAPKIDQNTITSSGQTNPSQLLDSASRSVGTESGTGAAGLAGGAGNVEIGRDASTNNVV